MVELIISELDEVEKSILIELTDFNTSLRQIAIDIHFEDTSLSVGVKFTKAEDAIIRLLDIGFVSIQKNRYKESNGNEIELINSESLSIKDARIHLGHPVNWMSEHGVEDGLTFFEIAPTEIGKSAINALFENKEKT